MRFFWMKSHETPEKDLETLDAVFRRELEERLVSLLVYGSYVSGGYDPRRSDLNILVVLRDTTPDTLERATAAAQFWIKKGHLVPVLLGIDELPLYAKYHPIECSEIREDHRVLAGSNPFSALEIQPRELARQCLTELVAKQARLRRELVVHSGRAEDLQRLLATSVSGLLVLLNAAWKVLEPATPLNRWDASKTLLLRAGIDGFEFDEIRQLHIHRTSDKIEDLAYRYSSILSRLTQYLSKELSRPLEPHKT